MSVSRPSDSTQKNSVFLSNLVEETLHGLSPIQTIMKMAEPAHIASLGIDPETMISFGGGWCNHTAPETLRSIYQKICSDRNQFNQSGRYSPIKGQLDCRTQLCAYEYRIFQVNHLLPDQILLGHSSTQLFHDILRVIANPSDPICLLDPTYANYMNAIKCALPSSPLRFLSVLDIDHWDYLVDEEATLEQFKQLCSDGVRVIVIPLPDNPTSQILPDSCVQGLYDILEDFKGFLVLDFAYKTLWFDKKPACFSWSPVDHPHGIFIHSNSKWLSSLGRRLGWIEADTHVIESMEKINESMLLSPDTMHSQALARFLQASLSDNSLVHYIDDIRKLYRKTASVLIRSIDKELGWSYLSPQGGLYTCCPTPKHQKARAFVEDVLTQTGVLLIPGDGFGPSMKHAVRISYGPLCYDHDLIIEGIERVAQYLGTSS